MNRPFLLGLTGSIGMGKSTTAAMFAEQGVPVWDADAAVHRLYAAGGAAVPAVGQIFPTSIRDNALDRAELKRIIAADPKALGRIEKIVHPLVAQNRAAFIQDRQDAPIIVLDIPLLFETGSSRGMDAVAVVSAPYETQPARVLERPGMTEEQFQLILSRQVPDAEKRAKADFVIPTTSLEQARAAVKTVLQTIRERRDA